MAMQISLKSRALRYLSAREHSRLELGRKLARHAQEGDDVEALLDMLEAAKFLSDARFSESLLNRRWARFGNSRILAELKSHGIVADALVDIKHNLAKDETARAREVWRKKFGRAAESANEHAKQIRFLSQRGFSHRAISAALHTKFDMDIDVDIDVDMEK
jgi:regulatory protein